MPKNKGKFFYFRLREFFLHIFWYDVYFRSAVTAMNWSKMWIVYNLTCQCQTCCGNFTLFPSFIDFGSETWILNSSFQEREVKTGGEVKMRTKLRKENSFSRKMDKVSVSEFWWIILFTWQILRKYGEMSAIKIVLCKFIFKCSFFSFY